MSFPFPDSRLVSMRPMTVAVPGAANSQDHQHEVGHIHFPVSRTPEAQKAFEHSVSLLHSFWYDEAQKTFSGVIRLHPACAMAYWGIATSLYHPVWFRPRRPICRRGSLPLSKAKSIGAKTQRERDSIAAVEEFYTDSDKVPHRQRTLAWPG